MQSADNDIAADNDDGHRACGWLLVGAAILSMLLALVHPQVSSTKLAIVVRQLAEQQLFTAWVHGLLIAAYLFLVVGFVGLALLLGPQRPTVLAGLVFYAAGVLAMTSAAVINGFALAIFAGRNLSVPADKLVAVASAFNMAGSIAVVWAGIGAVATSSAILAWSANLVRARGECRIVGMFGLVIAAATLFLLISGTIVLDVHGFLLLVVSQAAWTIWVGSTMIRGILFGDLNRPGAAAAPLRS